MKKHTRGRMLIANWKMYPDTRAQAVGLARRTLSRVAKVHAPEVTTVLMPPILYLPDVSRVLRGKPIHVGVQDVIPGATGSETGAISMSMITEFYAKHVLVGHSEIRARGESLEAIREKVAATLVAGYTPIVCVGECIRDDEGAFFDGIEEQVITACEGLSARKAEQLVIAYEPLWAIGSGVVLTAHNLSEMRLFILKLLTERFSAATARKIRILYGGSVEPESAAVLVHETQVDGFLVGGASHDPDAFAGILEVLHTV